MPCILLLIPIFHATIKILLLHDNKKYFYHMTILSLLSISYTMQKFLHDNVNAGRFPIITFSSRENFWTRI